MVCEIAGVDDGNDDDGEGCLAEVEEWPREKLEAKERAAKQAKMEKDVDDELAALKRKIKK